MKALLVIDFQNGFLQKGDFHKEKGRISNLIDQFKRDKLPVIFMRHIDKNSESPITDGTTGGDFDPELEQYADYVIEKSTPSSFYRTKLQERLNELGVSHIVITGFNTEFCPQFTAIAAFDRGYQVTFIEDATVTVNDDNVYEFPGLDIRDFVGTVLAWSDVIEVLDYDEYVDEVLKSN